MGVPVTHRSRLRALVGSRPAMRVTMAVATVAAMATTVAGIVVLHALGSPPGAAIDWGDPLRWLDTRSGERVALATGRVVALGALYWLAASMAICALTRVAGFPGWVRRVEWLALPPVRRMARRVAAATLAVTSVGAPGQALATAIPDPPDRPDRHHELPEPGIPPPVPVLVPVPPAGSGTAGTTDPDPPIDPTTGSPPPAPWTGLPVIQPFPTALSTPPPRPVTGREGDSPAPVPTGERTGDRDGEHVVVAGESLWSIAETRVAAAADKSPTENEVARYWSRLVDANRGSLRSGDPDLIHPGEVILCPPVDVS